jgi:hypothetical protein
MNEALEMAESHIGRRPSISLMHFPPILLTDVMGTPESVGSGLTAVDGAFRK